MTRIEVQLFVKKYLDEAGRNKPRFRNNVPGEDWVRSFLARHEDLQPRIARNINYARSKVDPETVKAYFENLEETLREISLPNMINFDETNLSDDPGSAQAISKRGTKYPELVRTTSKTAFSIMFAGSADTVYKSEHLYDTWDVRWTT